MKVAILGSGQVGQVLGTAFLKEGYEVTLAGRNAAKPEMTLWKEKNPEGNINHFSEAAQWGDIIVLAVKGDKASLVMDMAGLENFYGKIVIDTTNPIDESKAPLNGVLNYFTGLNESLMERLQAKIPAANFVKAFNSVGNALMYKPQLSAVPTMFIAGNDEAAKKIVTGILAAFGWETADMGKAEAARAIEPLCILWCIPGFLNNQWVHAFKLLKQ
jgi:8-hydroxy-5-deazaflavin:NADPH oxidoreductase